MTTETSRAAYATIKPKLPSLRLRIATLFLDRGPMILDEIANALPGGGKGSIDPRIAELLDREVIVPTGQRRPGNTEWLQTEYRLRRPGEPGFKREKRPKGDGRNTHPIVEIVDAILARREPFTIRDLDEQFAALGWGHSTARSQLPSLVKQGLVVFTGEFRYTKGINGRRIARRLWRVV